MSGWVGGWDGSQKILCSHILCEYRTYYLFFFFFWTCLKRKSEKAKIARPKSNKQKCSPCGRTSNYRKSWAPRPQQLETPRLTLGKNRGETSLKQYAPQQDHCHQFWYSLRPGVDICLVSVPAQNSVTNVESFFACFVTCCEAAFFFSFFLALLRFCNTSRGALR